MANNSSKIFFFFTLISGLMIAISANSWFGIWMGLEINLLSFIPIISNNKNIFTTEASLKYFLIQTLSSSSLLFLMTSKILIESMFLFSHLSISIMLMNLPLLLKMGAAPFHWWFPSVMEGLNWHNCFLLMTMQKITPLILISYFLKMNTFMIIIIITSIMVGAMGGINQISMRKIFTYSSINHMGWMLSSMTIGENLFFLYFKMYCLLIFTLIVILYPYHLSLINQTFLLNNNKIIKFLMFCSLLSLGGLPPFLGFLPKWLVIQSMLHSNMFMLTLIMIIMSLLTLYYYLRISFSAFLMLNFSLNWINFNYKTSTMTMLMFMISLMGFMLISMIIKP